MNTATCIRPHGTGVVITTFDDVSIVEEKLLVWEDKKPPPKRFHLTDEQHKLFIKALKSSKGSKVIKRLKNRITNTLVNHYLEGYLAGMDERKSLAKFTKEVAATTLVGDTKIRLVTLGLTRKEIYNEFVKEGLIKI